jgi:HlyD family secretion protein
VDTETNPSATPELSTPDYGPGAPAPWKRWARWAAIALVAIVVGYLIFGRGDGGATKYVTQDVTTGDLTVTVTATGNLEPRNQVDIGSELSGTIRTVTVDVNDQVKAGQVLTKLDTTRLEAQVLQAQSSLASAEARVLQSVAGLKEARANLARLEKVRELSNNKLPSQQDMDVAESAVAQGEGEEAAARAAVAQAKANLDAVKTDLSKTDIKSPINGIVLVRSVEPGQTVASSLQAPVLFTLAEDLKKMELHVAVDEADIGSVEVGQDASFTVDAFPNRQFHAKITRVDFASNNTQKSSSSSGSGQGSASSATSTGVVTYETVLEVDNSDLLLRPGMTATAEIVTTNIQGATLVPNAALRFTPTGVDMPGAPANAQSRGPLSALMPTMPRRFFGGQQRGGGRMGRVWVIEDGKPALAIFKPGATDGRMTQVLPRGEKPNGGGRQGGAMANDEKFKKALERKIEPGVKVIVDEETPKK